MSTVNESVVVYYIEELTLSSSSDLFSLPKLLYLGTVDQLIL